MSQLPAEQAIQRFKENEERVDIFVNQPGYYLTNETPPRQVDTLIALAQRNTVLTSKGSWLTATSYQINDVVTSSGQTYVCLSSHTSGAFATDLAAKKWLLFNGSITGNAGETYRLVCGAIRNSGSGWHLINDGDHKPIGLTGIVENADGTVTLQHGVGAVDVGSLVITPDETYAKYGIWCGCSVGLDTSIVHFAAPLSFIVDFDTQAVDVPAHFAGDVSVTLGASSVSLTTPTLLTNACLSATRLGSTGKFDVNLSLSQGASTSTLYFKGKLYGYVYYDEASWQVTDSNAPGAFSFAWNTNELAVTHPPGGSRAAMKVTGRYPYHALFDGFGATVAEVRFTDGAGVLKTTPDTNMRFYFERDFLDCVQSSTIKIPIGYWGFNAGVAKVRSQNLTNPSGNFWIVGLMKTSS